MKKWLIAAVCLFLACGLAACARCGGEHAFTAENKCGVCGTEWDYTEGLSYAENADDTYTVSGISFERQESRVVLPYGHDGKAVTAVGEEAFTGRVEMTAAVLPQSVVRIGTNAFSNCVNLAEIEIPTSVARIGAYAFYRCGALTVRYAGTVEQWNAIKKGENWNASADGLRVECTDGSIAQDGTVTKN